MDKYVIKTPISLRPTCVYDNQKLQKYSQATIESLKGVVVIEDIEYAKCILERDAASHLKVSTLKKLAQKMPCKEILIKTQIGKTVHRLCKDSDPNISLAAKNTYKLWKENVLSKVNRPFIEVKCDLKTQKLRQKGRDLLFDAINKCLVGSELGSKLVADEVRIRGSAEHLERGIFRTKYFFDKSYQKTIRKIIFTVRHQQNITLQIVNSERDIETFIKEFS